MNWAVLVPIIIQYGFQFAVKLVEKWQTNGPVTLAELQELEALTKVTAKDQMLAAMTRAGIDPASDQGKQLLAYVS